MPRAGRVVRVIFSDPDWMDSAKYSRLHALMHVHIAPADQEEKNLPRPETKLLKMVGRDPSIPADPSSSLPRSALRPPQRGAVSGPLVLHPSPPSVARRRDPAAWAPRSGEAWWRSGHDVHV